MALWRADINRQRQSNLNTISAPTNLARARTVGVKRPHSSHTAASTFAAFEFAASPLRLGLCGLTGPNISAATAHFLSGRTQVARSPSRQGRLQFGYKMNITFAVACLIIGSPLAHATFTWDSRAGLLFRKPRAVPAGLEPGITNARRMDSHGTSYR